MFYVAIHYYIRKRVTSLCDCLLCKQTSACGDSLSSSPQADVLFYMLGIYSIFTGRSIKDCPWRRIRGDTNLVICLVFAS